MVSRRKFIKLTTLSATLPLLAQVTSASSAPARVPLDDPAAKALNYVEDATVASRTDKMGVAASDQICGNCRFYKDSETPEWGGCALFQNRLVAKAGWCSGWVPTA